MRLLMIGSALFGVAGVAAFSSSGSDAQQIVQRPPEAVYASFSRALGNLETGGPAQLPDSATTLEIKVARDYPKSIDVIVLLNQQQAGEAQFTFAGQKDGAATLVSGDIEMDRKVVRAAFADQPGTDFADAPDLALKLGMKQMLAEAAKKIEAGEPIGDADFNLREVIAREQRMSGAERREEERQRQEQAAAPMLDPNQAARDYLKGGKPGGSSR